MSYPKSRKEAVVVVVQDGEEFLGVSRRDDPEAFGLPGGKVDPGETAEQAAKREFEEETGFKVKKLVPFFQRTEGKFLVTAFVGELGKRTAQRAGETGVVAWVSQETLCTGPFGEFNAEMFEELERPVPRKNPMKQPEDLPGFRFAVLQHQKAGAMKGRLVIAAYDDQEEKVLGWMAALPKSFGRHELEAVGLPKYAVAAHPEEWAWEVAKIHAWEDGWGPLMYEAMLVLLVQKGYSGWLFNDPHCTSPQARAVWRKFANRSDIEFVEFPTEGQHPRFAMRALPALLEKRHKLVKKPDTDRERKKLVTKFLKDGFKEDNSYSSFRKNPSFPKGSAWLGPVYHGTEDGNFLTFIKKGVYDAHYFTSSRRVAESYAKRDTALPLPSFQSLNDLRDFIDERQRYNEPYFVDFEKDEATGFFELWSEKGKDLGVFEDAQELLKVVNDHLQNLEVPGIYSVFIKLENPLVVHGYGANWEEIPSEQLQEALEKYEIAEDLEEPFVSTRDVEKLAKEYGFDGFIIYDILDLGPESDGMEGSSHVYGVFDPRNIKSDKNRGTWDTSDPIITNPSKPRKNPDETRELVSLLKAKYGVRLDVSHNTRNRMLTLSRIVVPPERRGGGVGTQVMEDLHRYADQRGLSIALTPSADFGGGKARLVRFYQSLGYKPNKGKNKDYSTREAMIRVPAPRKNPARARHVDCEALGNLVQAVAGSNEAFALLDAEELDSFQTGGCAVLAAAVERVFGLMQATVSSDVNDAEHIVNYCEGGFVDSDGWQTKEQLFEKLDMESSSPRRWRVRRGVADHDFVCPRYLVEELAALLEETFHDLL